MPILVFTCGDHQTKKFYRSAKDAPSSLTCDHCGKTSKKTLSAPSSGSKITVDNGVQARAVEIVPNIVELNEERSQKNYRED